MPQGWQGSRSPKHNRQKRENVLKLNQLYLSSITACESSSPAMQSQALVKQAPVIPDQSVMLLKEAKDDLCKAREGLEC